MLRATPGLDTIRPGDANEVVEAWKAALSHTHEPTALIFSRQPIRTLDRSRYAPASGLAKGAYVLADAAGGDPEVILIGTGSEVPLVVDAHERLTAEGVRSRVVSMPSWFLFERQDRPIATPCCRPPVTARLAVEQGWSLGWGRYVGLAGDTITHVHLRRVRPTRQAAGQVRLHRRRGLRRRARPSGQRPDPMTSRLEQLRDADRPSGWISSTAPIWPRVGCAGWSSRTG